METKALIRRPEYPTGGANLRDFLTVFFKHRRMILIISFTTVFLVAIISLMLPHIYQAKSTILVKYGREYMSHPEVGTAPPIQNFDQEEVLNSEIQIIKSPDLARKVIETVKLENIYPDLAGDSWFGSLKRWATTLFGGSGNPGVSPIDSAVVAFEDDLIVSPIRKSGVIEVFYQNKNPQMAARAVNLLVQFFKEKHVEVYSGPQSSFLEGQVATFRDKLLQSQQDLETFKQKNRVYSLDEQRTLLLKQRTELHSELMTTQSSIDELEKRRSSLRAQTTNLTKDNSLYTGTERDKIIVDAKSKLLTLELTEQELLRKYTETNPLVVDMRRQIQIVRNFLREQEKDIKGAVRTGNPVFLDTQKDLVKTEADLSAQRARFSAVKGQLAGLDGQIQSLDKQEENVQNLKREVATNEKNYLTYGDKMQEARILDDMNKLKLANVRVIQSAAVPIKPSKPHRKLNVIMAAVFGSLIGLGYAFWSESNSQGLLTPDIAQKRLNLTVLAAIPYTE